MVFPRARMIVAACLFVAWLGFLAYLVLENRSLIVLSRPQFLVADLYVIADLHDQGGKPSPQVTVERVAWSRDPQEQSLRGKTIEVANLPAARVGFQGDGRYILPLKKIDGYQLASVPSGFEDARTGTDLRIYPLNAQTEAQLDEIMGTR